MVSRYDRLLQELYKRNVMHPAKMGLQSSWKLYNALDQPLNNIPILHVAGTNGKGSVCYKSSQYFQAAGLNTGLFVSPHISSYRERVNVNNQCLEEDEVIDYLDYLLKLCDNENIPATVFELTTAMAMYHFKKKNVDIAVLEVGLGGRLDSTNIISPKLSMITSIQLDHTQILGNTLDEIAYEKAGIIKPNIPILIGPNCPIDVIKQIADSQQSPLYTYDDFNNNKNSSSSSSSNNNNNLIKDPDNINTNLVYAAMTILEKLNINKISKALKNINQDVANKALRSTAPCRYQQLSSKENINIVLDVAHNTDAMIALSSRLSNDYSVPIHAVVGVSRGKDIQSLLLPLIQLLQNNQGKIYCVAAEHPRALPVQELREKIITLNQNDKNDKKDKPVMSIISNDNIAEGVKSAITEASLDGGMVLICGSVFIMSDARAALGIIEPKDSHILNSVLRNEVKVKSTETNEALAI